MSEDYCWCGAPMWYEHHHKNELFCCVCDKGKDHVVDNSKQV